MRKACKWGVIIFLILPIIFTASGCGYKDIDKRFFALAIGVDAAPESSNKRYMISLKMAIAKASKENPTDAIIVKTYANSMAEAVRIIKTKIERELDFSHAKVILIGEKVARRGGNAGVFYWFARRRDIQKIAWIAGARPDALTILNIEPKSERLPANALFLSLGNEGSETPYKIPAFYFDFKKRLIERGLDPFYPIVEPSQKSLFQINKLGLENKSKLKLILAPEETKLFNYLFNYESKSAYLVEKGKLKFIIDTQRVKTSYKIYTPKGKQPYIRVKASLKGRLEETNRRITNSQLSELEKTAEKQFNKEMEALLKKIQKVKLDPIGFGLRYRARHFNNNDWEEWQKIYPQIKFKVDSKIQITDTGLIE